MVLLSCFTALDLHLIFLFFVPAPYAFSDEDFNPEGVKKTGTKKSQLSLGSNNVRRSGRKKGGKNIQPPKKSIKDELEKTKLQLKELTGL